MILRVYGLGAAALLALAAAAAREESAAGAADAPSALALEAGDRLMVFAPHPDDEALACGGLIQTAVSRGIPVRVVFFTCGDNNQWSFLLYRKRPVLTPRAVRAMGLVRRDEAIRAGRLLGLAERDLVFLGYPDFGTLALWTVGWGAHAPVRSMLTRTTAVPYASAWRPGAPYTGESVLQDLSAMLLQFRPTKVFVSHPADLNPDHRALYLFARVALWDAEPGLRPAVYPYLTHFRRWPLPRALQPGARLEPPAHLRGGSDWAELRLSNRDLAGKIAALQAHRSQFAYSGSYLLSFVRRNELFGDLRPVDLSRPRDMAPAAPEPLPTEAELAEDLGGDERALYTDIEWDGARLDRDCLVVSVALSRPLFQSVRATFSLFGYRAGRPFAEMPKLRVAIGARGHRVWDGARRVAGAGVECRRDRERLILRVPLAALGGPDRVLASAHTAAGATGLDWIAWRVLRLPPGAGEQDPAP